jgi:hypothetical protein
MVQEKVWCRNLLCKGSPFKEEINRTISLDKQMDKIRCPHCGKIGAMLEKQTLDAKEIINQIAAWNNIILYKKAFKLINYKKLPKTIEEQSVAIGKQRRIKITKPIVRK